MKKTYPLLIIAIITLITSCDIEKRRYFSGFYVSHSGKVKTNTSDKKINTKVSNVNSLESVSITKTETPINENELSPVKQEESKLIFASTVKNQIQLNSKVKSATLNTNFRNISHSNTSVKPNKINSNTVIKELKSSQKRGGSEVPKVAYILLAIFIPFVAVGLATNWGSETWINLILTLLCGIPGIIHAFIILNKRGIL